MLSRRDCTTNWRSKSSEFKKFSYWNTSASCSSSDLRAKLSDETIRTARNARPPFRITTPSRMLSRERNDCAAAVAFDLGCAVDALVMSAVAAFEMLLDVQAPRNVGNPALRERAFGGRLRRRRLP